MHSTYESTEVVGVGLVFPPLEKHDLGEEENNEQDEDHLGVHLCMPSMLLVHPEKYLMKTTY